MITSINVLGVRNNAMYLKWSEFSHDQRKCNSVYDTINAFPTYLRALLLRKTTSDLLFLSGCTGSRSVYCDLPLRISRRIQSRIQLCRVHKLRHSALDRLRQAGSISKCEDVLILNLHTLANPRSFCSLFAWASDHASAIVSIPICIGQKLSALSS